jgi:hypothetical protein
MEQLNLLRGIYVKVYCHSAVNVIFLQYAPVYERKYRFVETEDRST